MQRAVALEQLIGEPIELPHLGMQKVEGLVARLLGEGDHRSVEALADLLGPVSTFSTETGGKSRS